MKIINEKGKLFGIINLVDLLVLLAVVLAVGGVGWRLLGSKVVEAAAPKVTMTYTVRVRGVNGRMQDEIRKNLEVNNRIIAGNDYVSGAYVTGVEFVPFIQQNPTAEGLLVDAVDPTRVDAIFTVQATVSKEVPVYKVGTQEIRVGYGHYLKTPLIEYAATIESVSFDG